MAKKQFKAESKKLMDMMVHSIYTHKEIFLRELISNASDAIDKRYLDGLSADGGLSRGDFHIKITVDEQNRTLTVSDNGIGMDASALENNLGVIAHSGSLDYKQNIAADQKDEVDIIGRFGVGFYSAFMVSDKVEVLSKQANAETAHRWTSEGADGYTIEKAAKDEPGTDVILKIKQDTEDERYSEFLDVHFLSSLVKKYSDYIRYPIRMEMPKTKKVETEGKDAPEYVSYTEEETVNSMIPIWQKSRSEVSDEALDDFYKELFSDMEDPILHLRMSTEGTVTYKALLFVPSRAPYHYFTKEYKRGLRLYASGVLIMDACEELLPECFGFVRGVVDSEDLSLNISREMLQHDRQLKVIASSIEKRVKAELLKLLQNDREKYETFYKAFGIQLKYGVVADFGAKKELLADLLLFHSEKEEKLVTLDEYCDKMPEGQKYIYYACGQSVAQILSLPQAEQVRRAGFDILCMTDDVDEFASRAINSHREKELRSISDSELGLDTEEQKKQIETASAENKDLLDFLKESLGEEVSAVKISEKLVTHPVCLSSEGPVSLEMERYFSQMPGETGGMKAKRVLELNAAHPVFEALKKAHTENPDRAKTYARILYDSALLIADMPISDPSHTTDLICELMV